jgi:hypothetical protein
VKNDILYSVLRASEKQLELMLTGEPRVNQGRGETCQKDDSQPRQSPYVNRPVYFIQIFETNDIIQQYRFILI